MKVYALCFPKHSTSAIFVPLQHSRPSLSANIWDYGRKYEWMTCRQAGTSANCAVWRQPSVLGSVSTFRVETFPPKMIAGRALTTSIAPAVFRNLQKRTAYCRRVTVIGAPARNKVSTLVGTPPCRGVLVCEGVSCNVMSALLVRRVCGLITVSLVHLGPS
jgi:hypothetical protein